MRLWLWHKTKGAHVKTLTPERDTAAHPGDPEGVAAAERELHTSQTLWERTRREVWQPLEELRQRNNVTGLAKSIVHPKTGEGK